jgi:tripartite-type tricarboxylate transporter receptor subunit TctC
VTIVRTPEIVERMTSTGNEPVGSTPQEFDTLIRDEIPKWRKVIREAGITLVP